MVSDDIKVAMTVSTDIRVTKAIAKCVLSNGDCGTQELSSTTNINSYNDRERKVLELYDDGKNTRDIAKELRMSLRDISTILRNSQVNHGVVITDNSNDKTNSITNKSSNENPLKLTNYFLKAKSHLR